VKPYRNAQSVWPVSVFGLGLLLLIIGLSGVASIQETRRIHGQILSVEDGYRKMESVVEAIRSETYRIAILRRDRLLASQGPTTRADYTKALSELNSSVESNLEQLRGLRSPQESKSLERLEADIRAYLATVAAEFQELRVDQNEFASMNDQVQSQRSRIFDVAGEISRLNEENFESRRRDLNQSVQSLQNDIWETMLTALLVGAAIAGGSVFRISALEKESAEQQKATRQAEERLRHLSHQLVSSQEQERKSLSRELHDEIGQLLTALRMELGNLERARSSSGTGFDIHLDQAKKLAESTLRSTRDIAMGLRPAMLDELGLGPAIEWQARDFSRRSGTPVQLELDGDLSDLPDRHRTHLYRIVQEGLTNCARHAHSKNVHVRLKDADGRLSLTVEDDGAGFDQQGNGVAYGLGLLGIAERVRELSGRMAIESGPGKGTRLEVVLPRIAPEATE
jgi:signal transduction histidine kinase